MRIPPFVFLLPRHIAKIDNMLRVVLFVFCLAITLPLGTARAGPDDPFRSERLMPDDVRLLQAALTLSGHYNGLIDGAWGGGSARALIAATRPQPTEEDVLRILGAFFDESDNEWAALNGPGASLLAPTALLLREDEPEDRFLSYATPTRDLILRIIFGNARDASDMHNWLETETVADGYVADTPAAYVTKGQLGGGDTVYLWTREVDGVFVTALVQWAPHQAPRGRLITASLSTGHVPDLRLAPEGYVAHMLDGLGAAVAASDAPPPAASPERPGPAQGDVIGTGTGFHVSDTAIVTAAHVVEGCATVRLAGGTPVAVLQSDRALDLAVVLRPGPAENGAAPAWLALSERSARLGAPVTVVGYPYSGLFAQGVTATRGNVSALRGLAGSEDEMLLSAPVQPGNSGGPLLDRSGHVIGVVTARASEAYVRERSGTAPQNMNVATRLRPLREFLQSAGIALPAAANEGTDTDPFADGLPDAVIQAVVQLHCEH